MKCSNPLTVAALSSVLMFGATSCSDDKSDTPAPTPVGPTITAPLTPDESKAYLEGTASEVLNLFNPEEQRALVELLDRFVEDYGDLDFPDEFSNAASANPVTTWASGLSRALKTTDFAGISRSGAEVYSFSDYTGIFEADNDCWRKVSPSSDVIFRFTDQGQQVELKATASGNEWSESVEDVTVFVPEKVTLTLTRGSEVMVSSVVNSSYNSSAHTLSLDVDATVMNLNVVSSLRGSDSKITETIQLKINGNGVISSNAVINGANLCDRAKLERLFEDFSGSKADRFFSTASGEVDVLGKVQVKGSLSKLSKFIDAIDYDEEGAEAKAGAMNAASTLESILPATVHYTNTSAVQATLGWEGYQSDYYSWGSYSYEYWGVRPILIFPDNTRYAFDDYFGQGRFLGVENLFESIIDKYEALWN